MMLTEEVNRFRSTVRRLQPGCMFGQSRRTLSGSSDIGLFRYGKGVITLDAKVANGALDR
jgi:hypothetical protein